MNVSVLFCFCAAGLVLSCMAVGRAAPAEVRVVDPHPKEVGRPGDPGVAALKDAAQRLEEDAASGRSVGDVEILAWSTKACLIHLPPAILEEAIVRVRWQRSDSWSLFYLERNHLAAAYFNKGWQEPAGPQIPPLSWSATFNGKPSEDQVVDFVRNTNFGNNEFSSETAVVAVFLYAERLKKLHQALARGIPEEEREQRRKRFWNAIAEPLD